MTPSRQRGERRRPFSHQRSNSSNNGNRGEQGGGVHHNNHHPSSTRWCRYRWLRWCDGETSWRRMWRIPSPTSTWSNRGTVPPSSSSTTNATSVGAAIPSISRSAPSTASAPSVPPLLSRPQEGRPRLVRSTGNRGLVSMGRQPPFSDMHDVIARLNHSSIGQNSHSSNANAYNSNVYSIDPSLFGNGFNNRGTNTAKIRSLPYFTIADVEKELPPDYCNCSICLQDFCVGDVRKTLPCLHGFHKGCADRWLGMDGCCPICKHRI